MRCFHSVIKLSVIVTIAWLMVQHGIISQVAIYLREAQLIECFKWELPWLPCWL